MGLADIRAHRSQGLEHVLDAQALDIINHMGAELGAQARGEVAAQGVEHADIDLHVSAHIRYAGTDTALVLPMPKGGDILAKLQRAFEKAHKARFGFMDRAKVMMLEENYRSSKNILSLANTVIKKNKFRKEKIDKILEDI